MKVIDAICVSSSELKRKQISFDEVSGLIVNSGDLRIPKNKVDYYFDDDCLLFAGMGDVHIHAREDVSGKNNYKEDFHSAQMAMHNGGVTHAGDMPNNPIPPIDDESYLAKLKLSTQKTQGEIWPYAGIGPGTRPLSFLVPYKVYMGPSVGELFFKDLKILEETLVHYQGQSVSFHCEDPLTLNEHKNEKTHSMRRPIEAEIIATKDALRLIEKFNLKGKLCHYSSGEGLRLIQEARTRGVNVQIEASPVHLYFDEEKIQGHLKFQMNPPVRSLKDRETLWQAAKNGEIDFLATDHAPHTKEEKVAGTSGLTGLDTYTGFVSYLISQGFDPKLLARMCSENPGHFFNQFLYSWKKLSSSFNSYGRGVGFIENGFRASFTVINKTPLKVTKDFMKTKSADGPFIGVEFPGSLEALFIGGQRI